MAKNRNTFRQHIRAAREWLGRAENSLDKENDIRGDLNLMLAQAELQRAKESNGLARKPSWTVRLAPLAMALLLVGGCLAFLQMERPMAANETQPPAAAMQASREEVPAKSEPAAALPADPAPAPAPVYPVTAAHQAQRAEAAVQPQPVQPAPAAAAGTAEPAATTVPSANMQKLMQSAGRSLRAQ